jgi:hypothetical protein
MRRFAVIVVSAAIIASTMSAFAAECTSNKDFCARWTAAQAQPADAADKDKSCRAYAASFYESVMLRRVAAERVDGARVLIALDSVINAFNDLIATKCGG